MYKTNFPIIFLLATVIIIFLTLNITKGAIGEKGKQLRAKSILRAASQWSKASREDKDPVLSLSHASQALAYLHSARTLLTDNELQVIMNAPIDEFIKEIKQNEKISIKKLTSLLGN
jgi:hypothetical protein